MYMYRIGQQVSLKYLHILLHILISLFMLFNYFINPILIYKKKIIE